MSQATSQTMTGRRWLQELCDATKPPPASTDAVRDMLSAWSEVSAARQAIFAHPARPSTLGAEDADMVDELRAREAVWMAALAAARDRVAAAKIALAKAKRYQQAR